ncbi:hypothetical protein AB4225_02440 [Streptomyces sp. 2RAF24]|uniref:hypothetical protein n=1 Tax=Streptomyces sp. 2RAF24 TaxID=3232997 RepID=UPI003F98B088
MRFEPVRARAGLAAVGAATALLLVLPGAALAAPAPAPVDVEAQAQTEQAQIYPGGTVEIRALADVTSGEVAKLGLTLALPAGVTYERSGGDDGAADATCTPAADGRSVTCVPSDGRRKQVGTSVFVRVGTDVAPGTSLPFTVTADIGDAVDGKPENNTSTVKAEVRTSGDLSLEWKVPPGPVHPGETVETEVVVTNHGPGPVELKAVGLGIGDYWPSGYHASCWPDPGSLTCDHFKELAPGATARFPFTWKFPAKAAGTTYKVWSGLVLPNPLDPNEANHRDLATFTITKAPGPAAGGLTPTSPGPLTALAATVVALAGTGALLVRTRRAGARRR